MNRLLLARRTGGALFALALTGALAWPSNKLTLRPAFAEPKPTWAALPNPGHKTSEPVTQTEFANSIRDLDNNLLRLAAVSVRCMLGLCYFNKARAYAFGVYLETGKVSKDLAELNALPTQTLGAAPFIPSPKHEGSKLGYVYYRGAQGLGYYLDSAYKPKSLEVAFPVMIRLVMLHDVDGEHLAHGFDKTLKTRLSKHLTPENRDVVMEQFGRFKNELHKLGKLNKGCQLDFYRNAQGCLVFCRDGVALSTFDCTLLGWGVVDAFVGKEGHLTDKQPLLDAIQLMQQVRPLAEVRAAA